MADRSFYFTFEALGAHSGLFFTPVIGNSTSLQRFATFSAVVLCMLLAGNSLGAIVTFPHAIWGHTPVHYYEVEDGGGQIRIIASPLNAGDHFSMQFDSLDALLSWKGGGDPPVMVSDHPHAVQSGISSIFLPGTSNEREVTSEVGYFNLRRAVSFADWGGMGSVVHFVMPWGMAWMEPLDGRDNAPLSITPVSSPLLFDSDVDAENSTEEPVTIKELLDPNAIANRLDIASKPEPTILVILGVVAAVFVIAILRVSSQLFK